MKPRTALQTVILVAAALPSQQASSQQTDPALQSDLKTGYAALAARKYRDAEKSFKDANKRSGNTCQECYLALASVYAQLGESKAAFDSCNRAIASSSNDVQRAEGHWMKGNLLSAAGNPEKFKEAETEFRNALQLDSTQPTFHFNLGLVLMRQSRDDEGKRELQSYLQMAPQGPHAAEAEKLISNPRRARENYAPDFTAAGLNGERISLSSFAGKIVVLDFWATWCPPCVASVPELKDLLKKYPPEKFVVISISADENEKAWREFIARKNMAWLHIYDGDHRIRDSFGVHSFPTYLVLNGEGIIAQRIVGTDPRQSVAYRLKDHLERMPELSSK